MNPQPTDADELQKKRDAILKQFRAHLHLVITAHQTGQAKKLETWPGPDMMTYCRELAEWPGHPLASELAMSVTSILREISNVLINCEVTLRRQDEKSKAAHGSAEHMLAQIDLAYAFILRNLNFQIASRSEVATNSEFLCETLYADTHAGRRTARAIRRQYQTSPEELANEEGGFVGAFAWDVYQRVAELDRLAEEFPGHVRKVARQMNAWPMLIHRHTNSGRRFKKLAQLLELGEEYPTDASEGARFRPDTPMVRYLDPIIHRLHVFLSESIDREYKSPEEEAKSLAQDWWQWPEEIPGEDMGQILRIVRQLPPLTKATALQWAEKAIVPLILLTDACDYKNCTKPVLQKIAKQKGVKSQATFKSRLLTAVHATLRRLARPA